MKTFIDYSMGLSKLKIVKIACMAMFFLFAIFALCFMQDDIIKLYVVKSLGISSVVYSLSVVFALLVFQLLMMRRLPFRGKFLSLSFVPSYFLLYIACLPVFSFSVLGLVSFIIILCIYGFAIAKLPSTNSGRYSLRAMLIPNTFVFVVLSTILSLAVSVPDVRRFELRSQYHIQRGEIKEALNVGNRSLASSNILMSSRAYALSLNGQLGELLFQYPITNKAEGLLPTEADSSLMLIPPQKYFDRLGGSRLDNETVENYTARMLAKPNANLLYPSLRDYRLCALLLNKHLDKFAHELAQLYKYVPVDSLPKHYREALILYKHVTMSPHLIYDNAVMAANYADFVELKNKYNTITETSNLLRRSYGDTYWWYYYYYIL